LGTTLVLKVVAPAEVKGPGFYSHLLPESRWLGGAASNLGGISYAKFADDIESWSLRANEYGPASVLMYPLVGIGERFPVAASQMAALQSGQPKDEVDEFRAILEAIAFAERLAYETLATAGAPSDKTLYSVGGGSRSAFWSQLRATISNRAITTVNEAGSDLGAAKIAAAAAGGGDLASNLDSFNSSISKVYLPQVNQVSFYEERYQEFLALISPFQSAEIR
jgi:xylulokinase